MAIMNHPPWEAWRSEQVWLYWRDGWEKKVSVRPECNREPIKTNN
jgi:hypothetical protein